VRAEPPDAPALDVVDDVDGGEQDAEADIARQSDMSAADFEAISGELKDPELFDPAEVANAPRAPHPLKPFVEALIFASPEPLTLKAMARLLDDQPREDIETALAEVRESYLRSDGLQLVEVAGGYQSHQTHRRRQAARDEGDQEAGQYEGHADGVRPRRGPQARAAQADEARITARAGRPRTCPRRTTVRRTSNTAIVRQRLVGCW
jgi:hypothetical protein